MAVAFSQLSLRMLPRGNQIGLHIHFLSGMILLKASITSPTSVMQTVLTEQPGTSKRALANLLLALFLALVISGQVSHFFPSCDGDGHFLTCGQDDLRYGILMLAAVKVGYKVSTIVSWQYQREALLLRRR